MLMVLGFLLLVLVLYLMCVLLVSDLKFLVMMLVWCMKRFLLVLLGVMKLKFFLLLNYFMVLVVIGCIFVGLCVVDVEVLVGNDYDFGILNVTYGISGEFVKESWLRSRVGVCDCVFCFG